ncbi:MAG: hypothetical protein JWN52_3045 [Actinomycetia bacterium]|nr:hypothetical protein [Actinomycetes bacterium]
MTSTFGEVTAEPRVTSLPLSHVSVELGHLYMEDFAAGPEALRLHFQRVSPWAHALEQQYNSLLRGRTARISTCFLIDDYFTRFSTPARVIPDLLAAADESKLRIDYIARESACAEADGVALAELMVGRLVPEPAPGSNGSRPPVHEAGWLCNGERSATGEIDEAMGTASPWAPPRQNSARHHSIFTDVELWNDEQDRRLWSCAFLAAVWQLLRLGLLRNEGEPVAQPRPLSPAGLPDYWDELPPVLQLNPSAQPFSAYRTFSVLSSRFLSVEHAVRTILSQVSVPPGVLDQVTARSAAERLPVSAEVVDRIAYVFTGGT